MINVRRSFTVRNLASSGILDWKSFLLPNKRQFSSENTSLKTVTKYDFEDADDDERVAAAEDEVKAKQNKSKLNEFHYNMQHDKKPTPLTDRSETLYYRRRLYGKHGSESNIDPSILWPSKVELEAIKEYQSVLEPLTFHEKVAKAKEKRERAQAEREAEEAEILAKVKTIQTELREFHKRVALKNKEALERMEKKNRLIEEVRRHFGYNIDMRDEKFKEMLEKKQKEERKTAKAEKKALREKLKAGEKEETQTSEIDSESKIEN